MREERVKMSEKICGIYKITNLVNGKVYIGQSIDIKRRWRDHRNRKYWSKNREKQQCFILLYAMMRIIFVEKRKK